MAIKLYKGDLPAGLDFGPSVAIDTETLGLNPRRDKLCLVQLSSGDGNAHLVQLDRSAYDAPHLKALLTNPTSPRSSTMRGLMLPRSSTISAWRHPRSIVPRSHPG